MSVFKKNSMLIRRLRFRYSLKLFLLLGALVSFCFGILIYRAKSQRHAVEQIESLGGRVSYDYHWNETWIPTWLYNLLGKEGIDCLANVETVNVNGIAIEELELSRFPRLKRLWVENTRIKDLEFVATATDLEELNLSGCPVVDVEPLGNLRKIRYLDLGNTSIVNFKPLSTAKSLEQLNLPIGIDQKQLLFLKKMLPNCKIEQETRHP